MLSYFILIIVNLVFLYLIGLYPIRELLNANYELGGLIFLFLSWILWIPSIFIVVLVYKIVAKIIKLNEINKNRLLTITIIIQIIAAISVYPGMALLYKYNQLSDQSKIKIEYKANNEQIDLRSDGLFVYKYKLSIVNKTNKIQKIQYRVLPMVEDPGKYTKYCSLVSATYNNLKNETLKPGVSILDGELVLFEHSICKEYNPSNSKVKLEIDINAGNSDFFQYIDTNLTNWDQKYLLYKSRSGM